MYIVGLWSVRAISLAFLVTGDAAEGEAPAANGFPLEPPPPPGPGETYKMFGMPYSSEVGCHLRKAVGLAVVNTGSLYFPALL